MPENKDTHEDPGTKIAAEAPRESTAPAASPTASGRGLGKPASPVAKPAKPATASPTPEVAYRDPRCTPRHIRNCGCTGAARAPVDPKVKFPALPSKR